MQGLELETIRVERLEEGRVLRLVLDAGKGNVVDSRVIGELRRVLTEEGRGHGLCALVLDHAGDHFSFGASVEEHAPGRVEEMLPDFHALARELLGLHVPILAAVRGLCLGGGLELCLLADRILASPTAKLGQPEIGLAVFAPIGSALLPRRLAPCDATDLLLSGRMVQAEEAFGMGLVAEIVDDPGAAALAWAREHLAPKSAAALRFATEAARRPWLAGFLSDLERLEADYLGSLMTTRDAKEGIGAFLEKREPRWEDR